MSSPYRPPNAPVADPSPPRLTLGRRPWPVSLASLLILAAIVDGFVRLARGSHFNAGFTVILSVALVFVALMLERGRNWARWVLAGVAALKTLTLAMQLLAPNVPEGVKLAYDRAAVAREILVVLCLAVAALLVFVPGRAWFERPGS